MQEILNLNEEQISLKNISNKCYLHIKAVDQRSHKKRHNKEEERQILELDFSNVPEKLKGECLYIYEGVQSEILSTTRFDENLDLSTTYLGRVDIARASKIKVEEKKDFLYQKKDIQ